MISLESKFWAKEVQIQKKVIIHQKVTSMFDVHTFPDNFQRTKFNTRQGASFVFNFAIHHANAPARGLERVLGSEVIWIQKASTSQFFRTISDW